MKDLNAVPDHIAIIMDGNGRWAQKRGLPRTAGHKAGVEALRGVIENCSDRGVKYLTLYAFSTENWKRPKKEVSALMDLLVHYLRSEIRSLDKNNVRITFIGDITGLPPRARSEVEAALNKTSRNTGLNVVIAINYGGRQELVRAVRKIASQYEGRASEIDELAISNNLDTAGIPDPDLIIRPSGELRISNFLLWQMAYSEFWFSDVLWPDFCSKDLDEAISSYNKRNRRFGGLDSNNRQVKK